MYFDISIYIDQLRNVKKLEKKQPGVITSHFPLASRIKRLERDLEEKGIS